MLKPETVRKDARVLLQIVAFVIVLVACFKGYSAIPPHVWQSLENSVLFGLWAIINTAVSLLILAPLAFVFWLGFILLKDVGRVNLNAVGIALVSTVVVFYFAPHVAWLFLLGAGVSWATQRWTHATNLDKVGTWATVVCVLVPHLFATALLLPQEASLLRNEGSAMSLVKQRDNTIHAWGFRSWGARWWQDDSSGKTTLVVGAYVFYPLEFMSPQPPTKIYDTSPFYPHDPADDHNNQN